MRELADLGHTVVCVIHQPSGAVFNTFDDLMLLCLPSSQRESVCVCVCVCLRVCVCAFLCVRERDRE